MLIRRLAHTLRPFLLPIGALVLSVVVVAALAACTSENDTAKNERSIRNNGYARLAQQQPAHAMDYSPSRDTINFWIDTWGKPGKLSYVYLLASNGQMIGYYVFKGLPVSYCAALTPTYDVVKDSSNWAFPVPAPGVDGVYYSGGQCSAYYGKDATTNSYIEYTVGQGISALIYERPLPRQDVEPLGFTTIPAHKK
jgi:hypothetical protein